MKNKIVVLLTAAFFAVSARAEIGVIETTGQFSVFSTTNTITNTSFISSVGTGNPAWSGFNFGTFDTSVSGNSLSFQNFYFENYAFNGGSTPAGGVTNDNWIDANTTATLTLYRNSTNFWSGSLTQSGNPSPNNRTWNIAGGTNVNLLSGASNGVYTLGFIIDWTYNSWTGGAPVLVATTQTSPGGDATFTVVPEPSTYALLGLSALALAGYAARRRSRS